MPPDSTTIPVTLEQALAYSEEELTEAYRRYMNPDLCSLLGLIGFDRRFVKAEGTVVTDDQGRECLDFLGGYGVLNVGHNHPEVQAAVERVANLPNILQASLGLLSAPLAQALAAVAPGVLQHTFFANSGTEAVEGALKIARLATGRKGFLYAEGSFHGKSFGSLSVTGRRKYQDPFEPLLPGCRAVPYGDIDALERELAAGEYAAYIVEPIQGEGGIVVPLDGYLKDVEQACRRYSSLFIADEIQTGFGRTGDFFAVGHDGAEPDVLVLAKALGGGIMPAGAFMTTDAIWTKAYGSRDTCLLHTSTFGGNTRACAAGLKTIEILLRDSLSDRAREKGVWLMDQLGRLQAEFKLVKEVRGRGLMIGIEFYEPKLAKGLANEYLASSVAGLLFQEHGIITAYTLNNPNVLRLEPPLTVTDEELQRVMDGLRDVLGRHKGFVGVVGELGKKAVLRRFR